MYKLYTKYVHPITNTPQMYTIYLIVRAKTEKVKNDSKKVIFEFL